MKIIYTMATFNRERSLPMVVDTIIPQCDELWVYLNEYKSVPKCLEKEKIRVFRSQEYGECGDIGKFHDSDKITDAYHFTVDDDILYPKNYTETMIRWIEHYGRRAILGVHGAKVHFPCHNYYRHRTHYHFRMRCINNEQVNVLGTGTVVFHTDTIKVKRGDFPRKNMADIWFAILAQKQKVPMVVIKHEENWMNPCPDSVVDYSKAIHATSKNKSHGEYQTKVLNDFNTRYGFKLFSLR